MKAILSLLLVSCAVASLAEAQDGGAPARAVVAWNERLMSIAEDEDGFLTLKGVRAAAMMHIAMHDALNANDGAYATHTYSRPTPDAHPAAAAVQAAFTVAVDQYPDRRDSLETLRKSLLGRLPDGRVTPAAVDHSTARAAAVLEARIDDGWDNEADYRWHPMGPGVYAEFHDHSGTPQGFIFGAGWGTARGFALKSHDQFRSPPPPAIDSNAYTRAFDEVKRLGRFQSISRTPDQTHLALWWKDLAERSHNRLARQLVTDEKLPLNRAARLFALLNMSIFDAYVGVFDNKFHYNHWRPYTAIRWAANDGNVATIPEETWTNLHRHTYAFPSYPSAHGTACAAAMVAIADTFGDDYPFVMHTPEVDLAGPFSGKIAMDPPTRRFQRFSEAAMECAMSRVYLGIHFRYDSEAGYELGRDIGGHVVATLLVAN